MSYSYLKNGTISGGIAIDLNATDVALGWSNLTSAPEIPGKNLGSSYDFKLPEVDYMGYAAPIYTINGIMQSGVKANDLGSTIMTMNLMGSFLRAGSDHVFFDNGLLFNTAGSTMVVCESFKGIRDNKSANDAGLGDLINYNLTLRETKKW